MSGQIAARPASGVECEGCRYQADKRQRRPEHVKPAEYLCDNCQRPLCIDHIRHEDRGDWWLCAYCLTASVRAAERRAVRR